MNLYPGKILIVDLTTNKITTEQDKQDLAYKCDYCGGEPACFAQCFFNALVYQPADKKMRKLKESQMK